MEHSCENCARRFFVPGDGTTVVASCPSCGGNMVPERDQPSGVNSDGDLRNMVDPFTGVDAGGDPSTEGILAPSVAGERTQPLYKRDESFASVKHAAQTGQATPSMPAGIHNGTMQALGFCGATINGMPPGEELYRWTVQEWLPKARSGQVESVQVTVQNDHPAYLAAAIGIVDNSSACMGKRVPVPEFKELVMGIQAGTIPPPQKQAKVAAEDDFDMGDWGFDEPEEGAGPTHKFIIDGQGTTYSLPEPTHHEEIAHHAGLPMDDFPRGLSLGRLNGDGSTEWYQHQSGLQPDHMAQALEGHFGHSVTIDPSLKPSSSEDRFGIQPGAKGNGRGEIQITEDPPMPRSYGTPRDRNEGLVRGGHLDQTIHMPYYATEKEALLPLAVPAAMTAVRIGGPLIAKKLAPKLMSGALKSGKGFASQALKTLGIHTLLKGAMGTASQAGGAQPQMPAMAPTLQQVTHVHADTETVNSIPALHENDGDTAQHSDGDNTNPEHDVDESGSGSMSPATALLDHLLPQVVEHYMSDDAGDNDPLIKALDEALEREFPGYKDGDDGDHSDLESFFSEIANNHKDSKIAGPTGPFHPGMGVLPQTPSPGSAVVPPMGQAPIGPDPAQNACPSCGSVLNPDGSCAQCGFGAQQTTPGQINNAVTPGTSVGGPSMPPQQMMSRVADTQGPYTPEQFKAVAEYLLAAGREAEIPHMYDAPWEYADVLAQVQNKLNDPPPAVAEPAQPPAPPMGMDPSMMGAPPPGGAPDPSMMTARIAAAVARFGGVPDYNSMPAAPKGHCPTCGENVADHFYDMACPKCGGPLPPSPQLWGTHHMPGSTVGPRNSADNIAPKCPKCDSHTTGINATEDGSTCQCHNCGNVWPENDITITAEVAEHPHDQPVLEHNDLSDDQPHPDEGNQLTWQTPDGQPLTPGQEYEMHSDEYSIPDIIRVEETKPGELVYTITGEYSELEDRTTITPEEVEHRGIKFLPVGGDQPVEDAPESTEPTATSRVPITTSVDVRLSDGRVVQANLVNGKIIIPKTADIDPDLYPGGEHPMERGDNGLPPVTRYMGIPEILCPRCKGGDNDCPQCHGNAYLPMGTDGTANLIDRDHQILDPDVNNMHKVEIGRPHNDPRWSSDKVEPPKEASWLLEGTNISATPAPWETPLPDLTGGPLEQEEDPAAWLVSDLPKTAGAKFNPAQQREFIDEDGEARNLDRLDIGDTHYRTREANSVVIAGKGVRHAQPDMAPDDHLVFGL